MPCNWRSVCALDFGPRVPQVSSVAPFVVALSKSHFHSSICKQCIYTEQKKKKKKKNVTCIFNEPKY